MKETTKVDKRLMEKMPSFYHNYMMPRRKTRRVPVEGYRLQGDV